MCAGGWTSGHAGWQAGYQSGHQSFLLSDKEWGLPGVQSDL